MGGAKRGRGISAMHEWTTKLALAAGSLRGAPTPTLPCTPYVNPLHPNREGASGVCAPGISPLRSMRACTWHSPRHPKLLQPPPPFHARHARHATQAVAKDADAAGGVEKSKPRGKAVERGGSNPSPDHRAPAVKPAEEHGARGSAGGARWGRYCGRVGLGGCGGELRGQWLDRGLSTGG